MGLDMYMYLRRHKRIEEYKDGFYPYELRELGKNLNMSPVKNESFLVGYWRKANAIHSWIIDRCAGGEDDCREVEVSTIDAEDLHRLCCEVLADHSKAEELLPTKEGFFFGGLEYDEYYFRDLEYTKNLLRKILDIIKEYPSSDYWIVYNASW